MERVKESLYRTFLYKNRYILIIECVLIILLLPFVLPLISFKLPLINSRIPAARPLVSEVFENYKLELQGIGRLSTSKKYIFNYAATSEKDFEAAVDTILNRFSYSGEKDIKVDYDYGNKEINVYANNEIPETFVKNTVQDSGKFEVLQYVQKAEEEGEETNTFDFLSKSSYKDLSINRDDFSGVTRLAIADTQPDDPASKFLVRITLNEESHKKLQALGSSTGFIALFADERFIGVLQNFSDDRYIISSGTSGYDFYSLFGVLKSPELKSSPAFIGVETVPSTYNHNLIEILFVEYFVIIIILLLMLVSLYGYKGFITFVNFILTFEVALLAMRFFDARVSEFTIFGLILSASGAMLLLYLNNFLIRSSKDKRYLTSIISVMIILISYLGYKFFLGIEATLFTPFIFIFLTLPVMVLTLNHLLIERENR